VSAPCRDAGADQGPGFRYPSLCRRFRRRQAGCPSGQRERSVKPSAQPTLVRTQHLPPHITPAQAVCGQIIAAGCWGCEPIRPCARVSSGDVVFGQVRALRPDPAGICGTGALLGAVEWWLSRSRAAAVTGEAGRWPLCWAAGSLGYAAGTWTPGGAGFSTAPLTVPGRLGQASVRPSPPPEAAQRPVPGWHDARRRLPRGPSRANRCRARRLGPGKHCEREADRDIRPWQVFQSGPPEKQRDAFIARPRAPHPVSILVMHGSYVCAGRPARASAQAPV
jgi:hypothetical protein